MRKTKKYYRDQVNKNLFTALSILPEIVHQYGKNPKGHRNQKEIFLNVPESWWNHYIRSFYFYKGKLFINVYWQEDSTDGNDSLSFVSGKTSYRIPAEYYDDGYRTRCTHTDINIDSTELYEAIKRLVNSL